ncbi:MAG: site-2 protease family protein [Clostridiales bacterium]|nr:site-2 protease family protein [Clostridiales bacterium]
MHGANLKTKLRIHPLFLLTGVLSAFTGQLFLFLGGCIAAIEHECAHAFAARRYGFRLDKIVLMPYGAVVSGDLIGLTRKQELWVCLAGPLANAATALAFVALWWLYPVAYPFTDAAMYVSLSLFLVNLLPAYPLDGGRVLMLALRPLGEKKAKIICACVTMAVAAGVLAYFVYSCFHTPAFTALAFAILLAAGAFGGGQYQRLRFSHTKSFARGVEEKRVAVSADCSLQNAVRFLSPDRYLVFVLYDGEEFFGELTEGEFLSALESGESGKPLRDFLPQL